MSWRKIITRLLLTVLAIYAGLCALLYFNQESLLFHPRKLGTSEELLFTVPFREKMVITPDNDTLSGVLFKTKRSHGKLVFFLHGNAGNIENLQGTAAFYNDLGYDFFAYDYRGFGKSSGAITSEEQFYADAQLVYDALLKKYREENTTIIGYSIGSAAAAKLAADNHPAKCVLMAPYYSMEDMAGEKYPFVPPFLVSYKFETFRFLPQITAPVCIFHGKNDGTIPYHSSKRLAGLLKNGDRFIPLEGQGHNGIEQHPVFIRELETFLHSH